MTGLVLLLVAYGVPAAAGLGYIGKGWVIASVAAAYMSAVMAEQRRLEARDGADPTGGEAFSRLSGSDFTKSNGRITVSGIIRLGVIAAIYFGCAAL